MTSVSIFDIVICKIGHWQEPSLIMLFKVDKNSKVGLYYAILMFCLTVSLGVECREEPSFDVKKVAK